MSVPQNWQLNTKVAKSPGREGKREPGTQVQTGANRCFLKSGRVNTQSGKAAKPNWGRSPYRGHRGGYQPKNPSWGCQSCKERGRGEKCDHCSSRGISRHVARECTGRRHQASRLGNGQRLFRRDTEYSTVTATSPINVIAVAKFSWRE